MHLRRIAASAGAGVFMAEAGQESFSELQPCVHGRLHVGQKWAWDRREPCQCGELTRRLP